jgi:hypothetical protein
MNSSKALQWLREDEIRFRSRGFFVMADQARRLVELVEAGDDFPQLYTYVDRGTQVPLEGYLDGGMAIVLLPMSGISLCITPDRAAALAGALMEWLVAFI